jgi:uncharacterized protein YeaO (DUF488 family)
MGPKMPGEFRILVDRVWPRGVRRDALALDAWAKEVAPSTELRRWFGHDPARWAGFRRRYRRELANNPQAWKPILSRARKHDLVLLFAARDEEHNHAVVLGEFLRQNPR